MFASGGARGVPMATPVSWWYGTPSNMNMLFFKYKVEYLSSYKFREACDVIV